MYKTKDGETFRYKSDAVEHVLATDADLAKWYRTEHGVDDDWIAELNASNCNTYGLGAPGELCDMILKDADVTAED